MYTDYWSSSFIMLDVHCFLPILLQGMMEKIYEYAQNISDSSAPMGIDQLTKLEHGRLDKSNITMLNLLKFLDYYVSDYPYT